ncbi:MAG: YihA family ribosome biogenesis GTP-binding protein [Elusimicrobia bacterium]|nr:YihA family ribosome biogenesis GTP-binding protein [Elusimicrobiota bacterium]
MAINLSQTSFFISETNAKLLPQSIAEVAFVGRSNVGKSSVINSICKSKNLARTSKTPGRTRAINIFTPSKGRWIVDLPGYGFARVTDEEKKVWKEMIETYISSRKTLKMIYILIDSFVGPTELDFMMIDWVRKLNIPFKVVSNKTDKVKNLNLEELKCKISKICEVDKQDIYCVSAKKQTGFGTLINDIGNLLIK